MFVVERKCISAGEFELRPMPEALRHIFLEHFSKIKIDCTVLYAKPTVSLFKIDPLITRITTKITKQLYDSYVRLVENVNFCLDSGTSDKIHQNGATQGSRPWRRAKL